MSRILNDLSPRFRPLAYELIARLIEAGVPVAIVATGRTPEEHAKNLAMGLSWTPHSKHLDGDAIDLCPWRIFEPQGRKALAWNASDPQWQIIGSVAEKLGLRWGGRWTPPDMGHVEYQEQA